MNLEKNNLNYQPGMLISKTYCHRCVGGELQWITEANLKTMQKKCLTFMGAIDNLNRRMKSVEGKVPDYSADMLEVYRNIGALAKRISELEIHVKRLEQKGEKR